MVSKNDFKKFIFMYLYLYIYVYIFNEGEWLLSLEKEKRKKKGSKYDSSTLNFNKVFFWESNFNNF